MSGSQASTGIDMFDGAQLAANQLNAMGGVGGVKLRLIQADDGASPSAGITVAHTMVGQRVFGVVGPFNSAVGVKNLPIYRSAGLAIVRLTSAHETEGYGVTTQPMDVQVAPVEAKEITNVLHATRVAIVYDTSTYTASIANQLRGLLTAAGHAPLTYEPFTDGQRNFSGMLTRVARTHPDLLYIAGYGPEAGVIARQASAMNLGASCFVDLAAQGPDFVQAATPPVAQKCLNSGVPSAQEFVGAQQYVAQYQSTYRALPGIWGTFTYDSLMLLAHAVEQAGGWKEATVQSQLAHTTNYQGITGTITIEPKTGNRADPPVVILNVNATGQYVVNSQWAAATAFQLPTAAPSSR